MHVSVIIPAHNEEAVIRKMVTMLLAIYGNVIQEVIVVNDDSTDKTGPIVKALIKKYRRIKLINRTPPHGVGLAIREGLRHVSAKSTHILTLDADFIRNISDLEEFFAGINGYDGLIGSRYKEKYLLVHYPWLKKVFNRIFHMLVRLLFGIQNTDLTNNFKLYKRNLYLSLPLTATDYAINAETGLYPILMGYHIGELPVPWYARSRDMGVSKFNLFAVAPGYIRVLFQAWSLQKKALNRPIGRDIHEKL